MSEVTVQELAVTVGRHEERLTDIEQQFGEHCRKQNGSLDKLWAKLDEMDKYQRSEVARRPTWAVAGVITALTTICTGLIVYFVTH